MRPSGRAPDQLRDIILEPGFSPHAEGSCLARFGNTHVLVTASVEETVPPFLRKTGRGWVTAEYGMLPRATHSRGSREAARGKQSGRTQEANALVLECRYRDRKAGKVCQSAAEGRAPGAPDSAGGGGSGGGGSSGGGIGSIGADPITGALEGLFK